MQIFNIYIIPGEANINKTKKKPKLVNYYALRQKFLFIIIV